MNKHSINNQTYLHDSFNMYYNDGLSAKADGKHARAKRLFLLAADILRKLAEANEGEFKDALLARAGRIVSMADDLPDESSDGLIVSKNRHTVDVETSKFAPAVIPDVSFNDVAGLEDVKDAAFSRIINPRKYPDVYETFKKKPGFGCLLYGVPGNGKTMIAKAIAHEVDATFYPIRCSDIVGKYFGEAEKNIRALFDTARQESPSIIFFDEFESLGSKRGGNSTVMNRLVPELLSQINGFTESKAVVMILAATNRPWDIDSAFLRPERFSELIYIPLPDHAARKHIIKNIYTGVPIEPMIDFSALATEMDGYSGADVVEFCDRSKDNAIKRCIQNGGRFDDQMVTAEDIRECAAKFSKSVQQKDLDALERFKAQYDNKS